MLRYKQVVLLLVLVVVPSLLAGGCYSVRYATGARGGAERSVTNHHFLFGLAGTAYVDLAANCGDDGTSTVEVTHSFVNQIAAALTLGLWTPTTTYFRCATGRANGPPESHHSRVAGGAP